MSDLYKDDLEFYLPLSSIGLEYYFIKLSAVALGYNIEVNRDGYVEFSPDLYSQKLEQEKEVIKVTVKTTSGNGLLFWRGQPTPIIDLARTGHGAGAPTGDFLAIGVKNGYVEFRWVNLELCWLLC